ncbi:hypothetical protein [Streptomyces sp. SD31]|uniref:hypothetical protein n=1 Tax=Streptomyces sp. SD31 TaxID=3452208 RepID=UPI003F8B43A8
MLREVLAAAVRADRELCDGWAELVADFRPRDIAAGEQGVPDAAATGSAVGGLRTTWTGAPGGRGSVHEPLVLRLLEEPY